LDFVVWVIGLVKADLVMLALIAGLEWHGCDG
jgi:hypothetical protein